MDEVADESVALVVTSPPYWNAIDYAQHVADPTEWYRTRRGGPYEEYLDWLRRCFGVVFQKVKEGGFCAVVIGTVLQRRKQYPLPQHFVLLMEALGFEFHQEIVWNKVTGGVKRAGVTIQHPYPGYYCPNIMTEGILIFRKPGPRIYEGRTTAEREESRIPIDRIFTRELANNVWHIAPVPPNHLPHPCPFPEEIPYRLISLYTYVGDTVLDPFNGIGTTTKVACALRRDFYGYDLQPRYVEVALRRLKEPLHLRDQLVPVYEKVPVMDVSVPQARVAGGTTQMALFETRAKYATAERDRCDYEALKADASWLRQRGLPMVISPDLDGVLSAMLLQHLWQWQLVGFYDAENLWLLREYSDIEHSKPVFVDHDIYRKDLPSIGHHMLKWGLDTPVPEHESPQSVNPNLLRDIVFSRRGEKEFRRKYPFGTLHLLLACYSAWGDLKNQHPSSEFLPLLMNVDSSLRSAFTYEKNALDWLEWLGGSDDESSPIYPLCREIARASSQRLLRWKDALGDQIEDLGFKRDSQCAIGNPTDSVEWARLQVVLDWLEDATPWKAAFPDFPNADVVQIEMVRASCKPTKRDFRRVISSQPFSYAIIGSSEGGLNYGHLP
jgi:site-specific DNA-methyltransferase (adenine-specific)